MTGRRQFWFWFGGVVAFAGLLWLFSSILLPFVAAMVLAYLLDPLVDRLEKLGVGRAAGTVIVLVVFFLLGTATVLLLFPVLSAQIADFAARVPELLSALRERLGGFLQAIESRLSPADMERARALAGSFAGDALKVAGSLLAGLWSGGLALFNLLTLIFITPIVAFYLLRDWDRIIGAVDSWLPRRHADTIRGLARETDGLLAGFIRGAAMVCLILGVFYAIALTLIGLEFGLIIGLLSGIASFVPFVGALFGFVFGVGVALSQFGDWLPIALVAGVFVIGQVAEGNWLTPKLVGSRIDLHPVWVMFALLAGGALFGFLGVLLAVPLAVVFSVLVRFGLGQYLKSEFHGPSRPPGAE